MKNMTDENVLSGLKGLGGKGEMGNRRGSDDHRCEGWIL
jgi:hypothetical protein